MPNPSPSVATSACSASTGVLLWGEMQLRAVKEHGWDARMRAWAPAVHRGECVAAKVCVQGGEATAV